MSFLTQTDPPPQAYVRVSAEVHERTRRVIQGVEYFHSRPGGGDLFLTRFGLALAEHLQPENWYEPGWFAAHRCQLRGTSTIYRTSSRPLEGRSLDLVVRYNRMGQDLPGDPGPFDKFPNAEFNSPFEEVSKLMQLRLALLGEGRRPIHTKRPLAIYVSPERFEVWQTGRSRDKIAAKQAVHHGVELDIHRLYLLVYGWIDGMDTQDAAEKLNLPPIERAKFLRETTEAVVNDLAEAGFHVLDMKPAHIIVRFGPNGQLLRRKDGRLVHALVDYELLDRI